MSFTSDELLQLYESHGPVVFRRAYQLMGREAEAWDVVQDAFVVLLEQGRRFKTETRPIAYILGITTHLCLRRLRDGRTRDRIHAHLMAGATVSGHLPPGEDQAIARNFLNHLIDRLGQDDRTLEVAVYKYMDGMTQEQIAATMGVSRKTVQRDLDALGKLADSLIMGPGGA